MDTAQVARAWYDAINRRDFEALTSLFDERSSLVDPAVGTFTGPSGARAEVERWLAAFPNLRVEVKNLLAAGEQVLAEFILRGTHTGGLDTPYGVLASTGRTIELPFCDVFSIRDGRILKLRTYYDSASLWGQLGLVPELPMLAIQPEELRVQ